MAPSTRNNLIAITCFGPIAVLLLPWGLLLLPMWLSSLENQLAGNPKNIFYGTGVTIWTTIWPIATLLLGIAGIIGLFRVLSVVNHPERPYRRRSVTRILVVCGVLGVVIFNVIGGGMNPFTDTLPAMIYWILPLCGTIYFLYIARDLIFTAGDLSE